VMAVLSQFSPLMEVYSVDEAFLDLTGQSDLRNFGAKIKRAVERNTGIPVGVGIGSTKTLAKIANHIAKKYPAYNGVVELTHKDNLDKALSHIKVNDIWGVGKASTHKLHSLKIYTAKDYRDYKNDRLIKKIFTKVGLQRKDELSGVSRFPLEVTTKKKKEIICSRTFGAPVFTKESLKESVANYVSSACEKLRKQSSVCGEITVFMRTSPFKSVSQYYAMDSIKLLSHSCDTRVLIKYAFIILEDLYQSGIEYKKAGIKLSEIRDKSHTQLSLFEMTDFISSDHLMKAMDRVNTREGSGSLKTAVCGVTNKAWAMNRNHKSKRFLTGWNDLKGISC